MAETNNILLGQFIKEQRHKRGVSISQFGEIIKKPSASISRWERGYSMPTIQDLKLIIQGLKLNKEEVNELLIFAGVQDKLDELTVEKEGHDEQKNIYVDLIKKSIIEDNPIKNINVQIQDINESVELLKKELLSDVRPNDKSIENEIDYLKKSILELQAASQKLTAPVKLPTPKEMEVKLIPSSSFERLEEYREEQSKWASWFGIFIGGILGLVINLITGGTPSPGIWTVTSILVIVAALTGWASYQSSKKAEKILKQFTNE